MQKTKIFEFFMLGLRLTEGISSKKFKNSFSKEISDYLEPLFSQWKEKGLAIQDKDRYKLTKTGLLFLNSFLEELL